MNANLCNPWGVFVSNGEVFICDTDNHCIRKLLLNGQIMTIAGVGKVDGYNGDGQLATDAQLTSPTSVFVSSSNQVYISDDNRIRKIDQNGMISTIAGTGVAGFNGDGQLAIHAELSRPSGLFVNDDEEVFFCDSENHRVRKVDQSGIISTIAGNGMDGYNGDDILATSAQLNYPTGVYVYKHEIYISDFGDHRIRKVLQNGMIKTIAGTGENCYNGDDQPAICSQLCYPYGIHVHNDQVYISDHSNNRVRKILPNGIIKTIAGTGCNGDESQLQFPTGIFVDDSGVYFGSKQSIIRKVDHDGMITTIAGTGEEGYSGDVPFDFAKYPHIGPKKE